jgi:hypothetical protein
MKPLILNADYMISKEQIPDVDVPVEIHFTRFGKNQIPGGSPEFIDPQSYKIFCHVNEPTTSRWVEPVHNIITHHKKYDKIVTSNPTILDNCNNASFMLYGTTWLNKSKHHPDSFGTFDHNFGNINKEFSLSMICGSLHGKHGYDIRRLIFFNQHNIKIPKKFYSSTRFRLENYELLPNDDKIYLFNSMYSVAIESSSEKNYITEKLIDCLITKTIPVYWGCPNAEDFFDTSYWIPAERAFDFNYTENYYYDNLTKIVDNFNKAIPYCDNIFDRILNFIEKK